MGTDNSKKKELETEHGGVYSSAEQARIKKYKDSLNPSKPPQFVQNEFNGSIKPIQDSLLTKIGIYEALGTSDFNTFDTLIHQIVKTFNEPEKNTVKKLNIACAILHEIAPRNLLEGLLAVQMIGVHHLAMECLAKAQEHKETQFIEKRISQAVKLLKTFTLQMDVLNKSRNKGQQKMTVEHVHINDGGQAIIGDLSNRGRGT